MSWLMVVGTCCLFIFCAYKKPKHLGRLDVFFLAETPAGLGKRSFFTFAASSAKYVRRRKIALAAMIAIAID